MFVLPPRWRAGAIEHNHRLSGQRGLLREPEGHSGAFREHSRLGQTASLSDRSGPFRRGTAQRRQAEMPVGRTKPVEHKPARNARAGRKPCGGNGRYDQRPRRRQPGTPAVGDTGIEVVSYSGVRPPVAEESGRPAEFGGPFVWGDSHLPPSEVFPPPRYAVLFVLFGLSPFQSERGRVSATGGDAGQFWGAPPIFLLDFPVVVFAPSATCCSSSS